MLAKAYRTWAETTQNLAPTRAVGSDRNPTAKEQPLRVGERPPLARLLSYDENRRVG